MPTTSHSNDMFHARYKAQFDVARVASYVTDLCCQRCNCRVKFQPDTAWMSDALSAISVHLPFIDPPVRACVRTCTALLPLLLLLPAHRVCCF